MSNREILKTVPKVLDLVGLADKAHKFPAQLSGGQQQRVSIARSVARQPKILIADEPTGNVDKLTRQEIIDLLQKINDFGTTLLVTTHDETIVNNLGKRVVTLKAGRLVDDQKYHGVYRLDSEPEAETLPIVQKVFYPGSQRIVTGKNLTPKAPGTKSAKVTTAKAGTMNPDTKVKIEHEKTKASKPTPAGKTATKAAKSSKKLAHDSANQWYAANRPLKAAPKLTDLGLGQTVKLRPAPSARSASKRAAAPKTKTKRVI